MPAENALRFTSDPTQSATLPGHYYVDPAIFERESEQIFYKTWQFVGFTFDLKNPGDSSPPIFLIRRFSWCAARMANCMPSTMCVCVAAISCWKSRGNKTIFTCPFHAWSYDTAGELKAAGNAENVAGIHPEDFHLSEVRVDTMAMLVFVNLDVAAASLADYVPGLLEDWRKRSSSSTTSSLPTLSTSTSPPIGN